MSLKVGSLPILSIFWLHNYYFFIFTYFHFDNAALPETSQEDAKEMAKKVLAAEQVSVTKLRTAATLCFPQIVLVLKQLPSNRVQHPLEVDKIEHTDRNVVLSTSSYQNQH